MLSVIHEWPTRTQYAFAPAAYPAAPFAIFAIRGVFHARIRKTVRHFPSSLIRIKYAMARRIR